MEKAIEQRIAKLEARVEELEKKAATIMTAESNDNVEKFTRSLSGLDGDVDVKLVPETTFRLE